mmetsp:Transcript_2439/g.5575  ORF Transcript_2439/g.5575 Transcript_2439/m.5575 type:complete len:125 (+) Transcript_2439:304-678(+)
MLFDLSFPSVLCALAGRLIREVQQDGRGRWTRDFAEKQLWGSEQDGSNKSRSQVKCLREMTAFGFCRMNQAGRDQISAPTVPQATYRRTLILDLTSSSLGMLKVHEVTTCCRTRPRLFHFDLSF